MGIITKIISFLTSLIISFQALCSLPVLNKNFGFDVKSIVFESGDEMYTVMWTTTKPGSGYVTYTYDGKEYTVYDQVGGVVRSLDTIHAVRVPKKHLDNNTYIYHSQYVGTKQAYTAVLGKTIDSEPVSFAGYNGEEEIKALVIADVHDDAIPWKMAMEHFTETPSIIILDGDIASKMENEDNFKNILRYAHLFSDGKIPVAYARGNHEPRGEYASEMLQYFRTSTGGLYYTFNYGPLWAVVLDSGEDKEDGHEEYSGLVNFRKYIEDETKWLSDVKAPGALYQIAVVHKPSLDDLDGEKWIGMLGEIGIDAAISGHLHRLDLHFCEGTAPFYRFVTGPVNGYNAVASMFTFSGGNIKVESLNWAGITLANESFAVSRIPQ
ncbi:MAG: metallophosphoesterase [Clostridia bacterium]|nr:metallophosphoesterase [Clostridia bacterium]